MKFLSFAMLLFILLFGVTPFIFSDVSPQDLIMEISPNPVGKGDKFTVDFFIDYGDMTGISINPPELPSGITLSRGPYKRPYWIKLADGSSRKKTIVSYTYSTTKTGRFVIGSYRVTAGVDVFVTEPEIIRIGLYKNRKLYIPYDIEWSFRGGSFYEGQAVPLILEVKDLEEVMLFKDVKISLPDKGFMDLVQNFGVVSERNVGILSLYTVPVRGYIFTPASAGKIKIPSASVTARGIKSVSDSSYLTVLEIPEQIKTTGAIGNFKVTHWLENGEIDRNEKIVLHIKVEGYGNLNYFQVQEPSGNGLTLINTVEDFDYKPSINGYSGYRETVYSFIPDSPGDKELIIPSFPFLNMDSGNIIRGSEGRVPFHVVTDGSPEITEDAADVFPFFPKRLDSKGFSTSSRYKDPSSYLWLLPGPLVFIIFLLTGKKKIIIGASIIFIAASGNISNDSLVDIAIEQYQIGEYEKALEIFTEAREKLPDNSYISYNLSLTYFQLGDTGRSIYEARNAFYHDPLNSDYRSLVNYIEGKRGITYPVELSYNLYPDAFLFLLMILVNFTAFIGVIYLVKNKNVYFIISILLIGLSILTVGGFTFSIIQKEIQVGVAIEDQISVKKIPFPEADTVTRMESGESVVVKGDSDNFLFITTGTGIKGWVEKTQLLLIKD